MSDKKLLNTLLVCILFVIIAVPALQSKTHQTGKKTKLHVLLLEGTPYQRGLTHGKTLKNEIRASIKRFKENMKKKKSFKGHDMDHLTQRFLTESKFYQWAKRWIPDIIEEIRGIAEGSGIDLDSMMLFQVAEEFDTFGRFTLSLMGRCTSIGVRGNGKQATFVAQNMDIPPHAHTHPILLHVKDEATGIESYVYTVPGLVGLCGLNNKAVSITCNSMSQLEFTADGMPVSFIVRGVLAQKDYASAVKFIKTMTHATGQNYLIGGINQVESYECSTNNVIKYQPKNLKNVIFHTNHPLVNTQYLPRFLKAIKSKNLTLEAWNAKCHRFNSLTETFKTGDRHVDLEFIKKLLSNRKDYINNDYTYGTLIMKLSPKPELHIAPGRPDKTGFRIFHF